MEKKDLLLPAPEDQEKKAEKVTLLLLNLPSAGDPFAGTSSLSSYSLFSPTRNLIASI
jgi:hypothetical protein